MARVAEGETLNVTIASEPCAIARVVEEKKPCVTESSEPCVTARVVGEKETGVMVLREPCITARVGEVEKRPATAINKGDRVENASPPTLPQDKGEPELDTDSSKGKRLRVSWRPLGSEEGSTTESESDYERHTHHEAVLE